MKNRLILYLFFFTTATNLHAQLSGTYQVGASGDYTTLQEALDDLKLKSASGDVIFEIANNYSESNSTFIDSATVQSGFKLTIRPVLGADSVKFTSRFYIYGPNENIIIDGRPGGSGYKKAMYFIYDNGYNFTLSSKSGNDTISNSIIQFCNFHFSKNGGISCQNTKNLKISDNEFKFTETGGSFYIEGIYSWLNQNLTISNNKFYGKYTINNSSLDKRFYAIRVQNQGNTQTNKLWIRNNSIYFSIDASVRYASGLRMEGSSMPGVNDTMFFTHNSLLIEGYYNNNSGGRISLLDNGFKWNIIKNNIMVNRAVDTSGVKGNMTDNYGYGSSNTENSKNLVYVASGNFANNGITWYKTDLNPEFENKTTANLNLQNVVGTWYEGDSSGITTDINHFARNASKPTIGAFEINSQSPTLKLEIKNSTADVKLYPVPATDFIYLKFDEKISGELSLTSADGRAIQKNTVSNTDLAELNIALLPPGLYLISVYTQSGIRTFSFVK